MNKTWLYKKYCIEQLSCQQIADITGIGASSIHRQLLKFNIPRRPRIKRKHPLDREFLYQKYCQEQKSIRTIADIAGESYTVIRVRLHEFNIPLRKGGVPRGMVFPESVKQKLSKLRQREKNPKWLGDKAKKNSGRSRAWHWFKNGQPCEKCGELKTERHHIDGNPLNNEPENIQWLCKKCHGQTRRKHEHKN